MKKKYWILIGVLLLLLAGSVTYYCIKKANEPRKYKVKKTELLTRKQEMKVSVNRYEKALFEADKDNLYAEIEKMYGQYPENLIAKDIWKDTLMMRSLKAYLSDPVLLEIYANTLQVFPDLEDLEEELATALCYYQHYYPETEIPHFYSLMPGIDFEMPSVYGYGDDVFINLDLYLGADNKFYKQIGIPLYICARCDKKYIAIDCFKKAIVYWHLPEKKLLTLLDYMIYEGKKLYFAETMFPNRTENDIIGYDNDDYAWAMQYQPEVWNYLVEKDLLFSKSGDIIRKFTEEAPFTKPFSNVSPGRLGCFIGWQIVKQYMENNPEVTLKEMMQNTDSQSILSKSTYKPIKRI